VTFGDELQRHFGADRIAEHAALAPLTTFRVGGAADWLLEARTSDEIVLALNFARERGVPVTVLGGGSNVLIADAGVRGLIVRPRRGEIHQLDEQRVRADAAVTINGLVRWLIGHAAAGLEAWAGTPGTVGGAVYGNAHFGGRLIGDHLTEARLVGIDGHVIDVRVESMGFGYDRSRLQGSGEVLLSAVFRVRRGDPVAMRAVARESLAFRKRTQPLDTPSAGCIFQNPDPTHEPLPDGVPASAGALVDRAGLKGASIGGARVSLAHGNFIVNDGSASAADIRQLIEQCRQTVRERFGVELREEIVYIGEWTTTKPHDQRP
jgi:UDP-N-acetylmuramate dehydrogenase